MTLFGKRDAPAAASSCSTVPDFTWLGKYSRGTVKVLKTVSRLPTDALKMFASAKSQVMGRAWRAKTWLIVATRADRPDGVRVDVGPTSQVQSVEFLSASLLRRNAR